MYKSTFDSIFRIQESTLPEAADYLRRVTHSFHALPLTLRAVLVLNFNQPIQNNHS